MADRVAQAHRTRAAEVRTDLTTCVADLMADHAEGAEDFTVGGVAFGSEGGEFGELGVEGLGLLLREQRRCVDGFGKVEVANSRKSS